ncbi:peroxidase 64 [Cucumis melo var. makuwa]|uniref:Peroxidase 64 n=1 Tax=Cucumis melo var. makuwa TaxID=1194695 RepID=A0A5D3DGM1_CUCMM|nr:peroxidase 64 [Cucumis melo var. makuwa]
MGQTEVLNLGVEAYLRCFCGERPKEWIEWLHWAEYWYNTTYQSSIGISPFQALKKALGDHAKMNPLVPSVENHEWLTQPERSLWLPEESSY